MYDFDVEIKFGYHTHNTFKLYNITLVATKVHVILRSFVVLTWMWDKKKLV
jgi:hypothetical protein